MYTMQYKYSNEFSEYTVNMLYIHGGAYVNEVRTQQWDFLTTIIHTGTAKCLSIISTIPIYSIITPEVRVMNGGHEHAHAVMGSSKPPTGVSCPPRIAERYRHGQMSEREIKKRFLYDWIIYFMDVVKLDSRSSYNYQ